MHRSVTLCMTLCILAAILFPTNLLAQEEEQSGELLQVQTWRIAPEDAAKEDTEIKKIVQAAGEAGLSGPNTSWHFFTNNYTYTLVFPVENYAYFDDPQQFERRFKGTPGEALLQEAFAALGQIGSSDNKSELVMSVPAWSYDAASEYDIGFAEINEYWIKAGEEEAFGALVTDALAIFKDVGYPYSFAGHRVRFGDNRVVFVTWYDDKSKYFGEHSLEAHVESAGRSEDWAKVGERFVQLVDRTQEQHITYRPELSFEASPEQ